MNEIETFCSNDNLIDVSFGAEEVSSPATLRELRRASATHSLIIGDCLPVMGKMARNVDFMLWDPPYNTGRTDMMYHDRHEDWLSFMKERIVIGRDLLKDTGVIAIHIGYKELFRLGLLMDEVFGEENRLGIINWECTYGPKNTKKGIPSTTDYVLVYAKNKSAVFRGIVPRTAAMNARYKNPDNDPRGPWVAGNLTVGMNASMRPNQAYDLKDPKTGKIYKCNPNRVWTYIRSTMSKMIAENRIIFPKDTRQRPKLKRYLYELKQEGRSIGTYWKAEELIDLSEPISKSFQRSLSETNGDAKQLMRAILGNDCVFSTPKPLKLTQRLIQMFCPKDGVVMDAFGGSATSAHAVLDLNKEEKAKRRFIVIEENEEIAKTVALPRIKRVITGKWAKKTVSGTGGGVIVYEDRNQDQA